MADVTISSLPLGTPSEGSIIPFSQSNQTYSTTLAQLSSLPFIPKAWCSFDGLNGTTVGSEYRQNIWSSYNVTKVLRVPWKLQIIHPPGKYILTHQ